MHTIEMAHSRLGRDERYFGLAKSLRARGCRGDVDASQTDSSRRAHVLTFVGRLFDGLGRRQPALQARQPETYTEDDNEAYRLKLDRLRLVDVGLYADLSIVPCRLNDLGADSI